jgi:hypothetical protein
MARINRASQNVKLLEQFAEVACRGLRGIEHSLPEKQVLAAPSLARLPDYAQALAGDCDLLDSWVGQARREVRRQLP